MDNIVEFLITIALLVLFSVPSLLKKQKGADKIPHTHVPEEDENSVPDEGPVLQNSASYIPKQNDYFTYETLEDEEEYSKTKQREETSSVSQHVENKEEDNQMMSFNRDEVLKGVVYSEILKKKF